MKHGRASYISAAAVLTLALTGHVHAQDVDAAERAKNLIVVVDALSTGAGIIIGEGADRLYIVTANHVVRAVDDSVAPQIYVSFRFLPGDRIRARVLEDYDRVLDYAVIMIDRVGERAIPMEEIDFAVLPTEVARREDPVLHVGHPYNFRWRVPPELDPDYLTAVRTDELLFESDRVRAGYSGGGLFNANWRLLGMITGGAELDASAVPVDLLRGSLDHYPIALTTMASPSTAEDDQPPEPDDAGTDPSSGSGDVFLSYAGDMWGCAINVQFQMGNRLVVPTGTRHRVRQIDLGDTPWAASGNITCFVAGSPQSCYISGGGDLDLYDGAEYAVIWQNTSYGQCLVMLQET